jgi:amidase
MTFGAPLGISFFGTAFSEPTLIKLASGFEAVTKIRAHNLPTFAPTVPFNHIAGTTLLPPNQRKALQGNSGSQVMSPSNASPQTGKEVKRPHHL